MELDSLLTEALAQSAATEAAKTGRARLRDSRLSLKQRASIADKVREWESAAEYRAVSLVFRVTRYACECGTAIRAHGQVFVEERHLRIAGTRRFLPASPPYNASLPRRLEFHTVPVFMCVECAPELGFIVTI